MATNVCQLPDNKFTTILTESENQIIYSLLDINSKTLSTTLVRLLLSDGPEHRQWTISCIGIGCLVKDFDSGWIFIKIFDFVSKTMLWQNQLSPNIEYKCPEPFLMAYECSDCMVGINFSVEEEAIHFRETLRTEFFKPKSQVISDLSMSQDKVTRRSLNKDDINTPTNFRHSLRVFFNPLIGFQVTKPDDNDSNDKNTIDGNKSGDKCPDDVFESDDVIRVEEAFQFLRENSICSNDSNLESVQTSRPIPMARTTVGQSSSISVAVQTDQVQTLNSVLVNKFFIPLDNLTPPPIVKAMTYLASRPKWAQL